MPNNTAASFDPFSPRHEPARSLYDAFQREAEQRPTRSVEEWTSAEIEAVLAESKALATKLNLREPTRTEIADAERSARGHIDYGAKWAYAVERCMRGAR